MVNPISKKALLADLSISRLGVRRFDKEAAEEILVKRGAEKHVGLFTKRLLNKKSMEDIRHIASAARAYHNDHTLQWRSDGVRLLTAALHNEYMQKMRKFKEDFSNAVDEFMKEYPNHIKQAKKELGTLFSEDNYPPPEVARSRFGMEINLDPCPDTTDYRVVGLSAEDVKELKADLEKRLDSALEKIVEDIGTRISSVVGHMAEKLKEYKPGDKSKKKKAEGTFRDSMVENVKELAELLPAFNITGDAKLTAIQKRVMKELCGHDAEALREDETLRDTVRKSAEEILKEVQAFMA